MLKKKILIIDDTQLMVKMIKDILEGAGYEVIFEYSGQSGIKRVAEEKPDLVLLDIVMPGMDGFETCRVLRGDDCNNLMPIIMLTAQDAEDDKLTGLELGADDYIIKPFNPRELISRVNNIFRRIDRNRQANPLTGLPGNIEIQLEINSRITRNEHFAVVYADIDNFKAYNDAYGFATADTAIKLTADIITDNVHCFGVVQDFIGHIGGDDFVIITVPECANDICAGIIRDFDLKILALYTEEDRKKGCIATANRQGKEILYPIMSISIAVVSNMHRSFTNHIQVSEVAAELKKKAKTIAGSVYVKDRRRQ